MGLLDNWFDDPNAAGLMGIASGLLRASGPSRLPVGVGQALGEAIPQGLDASRVAGLNALRAQEMRQAHEHQVMLLAAQNAYAVDPNTGEVDVRKTRENLARVSPQLAMKFDQEQAQHEQQMINLSRKNEVAQSLIQERRAKILKSAGDYGLQQYFSAIQQGKNENQARQIAKASHAAYIGDAQKNMLLPANQPVGEFNVDAAMQNVGLMTDSGDPVPGGAMPDPQQDAGMQTAAFDEPMPQQNTEFVPTAGPQSQLADPSTMPDRAQRMPVAKDLNWGKVYAYSRLQKINPATSLMVLDPNTNQPIPNTPLIEQKKQLAAAGRAQITAAGGDVIMPGAAAKNELDKDLIAVNNGLARLASIKEGFKPEYLELPTQAVMKGMEWANKAGIPLSDTQKARLEKYASWRQDAADHMNRYIKEITGAQMGEAEAVRLRKAIPDPENDAPAVYNAKLDRSMTVLQRAGERYTRLRSEGLSVENAQKRVAQDIVNGLAPQQAPAAKPAATPATKPAKDGWSIERVK